MTDQLDREFTIITIGALVESVYELADRGMPALIGHDFTRPIGWTSIQSLLFEPGLTRALSETLLPETTDERNAVNTRLARFIHEVAENSQSGEIEELRVLLKDHVRGHELSMSMDGAVLVGPGLAKRAFPSLFDGSAVDDDGLTYLEKLEPVGPGVYKVGKLLLYAHPLMRRSSYRLNTLNTPFLSAFQELSGDNVYKRVRLDPDSVGLATAHEMRMEKSLWAHGAPFSDEIPAISDGVYRLVSNETELHFSQVSQTECFWYTRQGFHNFEAEELRNVPGFDGPGEPITYKCRYVHSMVPEDTSSPSHFDGAIRSYSEDEMVARLDIDLMRAGRQTCYTKLWRVDGLINVADWKRLFADYFRDNAHVGEYLSGASSAAEAPSPEVPEPKQIDHVPYSFANESGARLRLSFLKKLDIRSDIFLVPSVSWLVGARSHPLIEVNALDLAKALRREGFTVELPEECYLFGSKDRYISYPIIALSDPTSSNIQRSIEAIAKLVRARLEKQSEFVVTFGIRFPLDERDVVISLAGPANDTLRILENHMLDIQPSIEGLRIWAEAVGAWLQQQGWNQGHPDYSEIVGPDGSFKFERSNIPKDAIDFSQDERGLEYQLRVDALSQDLQNAIRSESIVPAIHYVYREVGCTRCGESYADCDCCKWLDSDCNSSIKRIEYFGAHWTDRPL
jgi:hypothetical protein